MGFEGHKIGIQIKRGLIFSSRICYRSVCNHPFLVGFAFFLIFLYRSFPFLFSILVSSSPVLVCTIVLLGTLLSFGQPHIPEIEKEIEKEVEKEVEKEEKITHEIAALKTQSGVLEDAVVVERGESLGVDRYIGKAVDVVENATGEACLEETNVVKVEKGEGLVDSRPLSEENFREIQLEKQVIEEEAEELRDFQCGGKEEIHEEKPGIDSVLGKEEVENQYSMYQHLQDEDQEVENDKSSVVAQMGDGLEFPPESSWKHAEGDNEPSDSGSDSGSDGAESSSPDASMADIIPLLDELHPLLDLEAPQPVCASPGDSDAASGHSHKSNDGSAESGEDSENHEEEEEEEEEDDDDDDADDDDEEEEAQDGKEGGTKSVITWTEDDQKNLMDLGTSELERNQRLENLIIRRRTRKNMRMMAEKNLIDLDSTDPPFLVPPISTARRNPFDGPCDSYDNMGLPPIPGSAPSVLVPRRNPFDLPYDSNEEKPDLKGDSFEQEFMTFHQRDTLFRRHESFSVGAASFGGPRSDKQSVKWRPYFVPERMAGEGTSYPVFERQSSGFSDSKASSVPETESVSSVVDEEDSKVIDQIVPPETGVLPDIDHVSDLVEDERQSSGDSDSEESDHAKKTQIDLNVVVRPEDEVTHREMGSSFASSIENMCVAPLAAEENFSEAQLAAEENLREAQLAAEAGEEKYSSRSSSSRSSEVGEGSLDVKPDEESSVMESRGELVEEPEVQKQPPREVSDFSFITGLVVERHHKEHFDPVYDSSPPAVEKNLSSSSICSDVQVEISEMSSPAVLAETTVPLACKEAKTNDEVIEDTSSNEGAQAATTTAASRFHAVDENGSGSVKVEEIGDRDRIQFESLELNQNFDNPRSSVLKSVPEHGLINSTSSVPETEAVEEVIRYKDESFQHERDQVDQLNSDAEIEIAVHQEGNENMTSSTSRDLHIALSASEEPHPSMVVEQFSVVHPDLSSLQTKAAEEDSTGVKEIWVEDNQVHSSGSDAKIGEHQDMNEQLVSADGSDLSSSEAKSIEEDSTIKDETVQVEDDQIHSLSSDSRIDSHQDADDKRVSVDGSHLSSSDAKSAEEDSTGKEEALRFEHDQVSSSGSDAKVGDHQDMDEKQVSTDGSNLSSSETQPVEESPRTKEASLQFENEQARSLGSDAKIDDQQDVDEKPVFVDDSNLSSSKTKSELEKPLPPPLSDKSSVELSLHDHEEIRIHEEPHEPSVIPEEYNEEAGISNNRNVLGSHEPADGISLYPSPTSILSEVSEKRTPSSIIDLEFKIIDQIENDGQKRVSGLGILDFPVAASRIVEENFEEADEIKELDEGLLAELDKVGDFSISGVELNLNEIEEREILLMPHDTETKTNPVVEDDCNDVDETKAVLDGDNLTGSQIEEENDSEFLMSRASSVEHVGSSSRQFAEGEPNQAPINDLEMLVIEARSLEDIDLVFKDIKLMSKETEVTSVESILPNLDIDSRIPTVEAQYLDINLGLKDVESILKETEVKLEESLQPDLDINSGMPAIEVRSLGDIDLRSVELMSEETEIKLEESMGSDLGINSAMPTIEARSLEDIDLALKAVEPISKENEVKLDDSMEPNLDINLGMPTIDSLDDIGLALKDVELKETKVKLEESMQPELDINSGMLTIEARSLEDIDLALKDVEPILKETEVKLEESMQPDLDINLGMPTIEARSLEDIDLALKDVEPRSRGTEVEAAETKTSEVGLSSRMPIVEEPSLEGIDLAFKGTGSMAKETEVEGNLEIDVNSDMLVIEARSLEDIDLALKDVELMSKETEVELLNLKEPELEINAKMMPTIEARLVEDIDIALKDVESKSKVTEPDVAESKMPIIEDRSLEDIDSAYEMRHEEIKVTRTDSGPFSKDLELPVLEARSIEDIDLAFKQLHGGGDLERPIFSSPVEDKPHLKFDEYSVKESSSDFQMVEARSLEDIHMALKQATEGNIKHEASPESRTEGSDVHETSTSKSEANDTRTLDHGISI